MAKVSHDSETLARGQQVITACALIHHDFEGVTKIFLPKRAATKKFLPDVFEIPGGHIDYGEDIVEGLKREVQEEFGMNISVGEPFAAFTYLNEIKGSHSIEVVYFARFTDPIDKIILDADDHSEYLWVAEDELERVFQGGKSENDPEFMNVRRAFSLLRGETLNLG